MPEPVTTFTAFSQIDLAALPPPDMVEELDFEALNAAIKAELMGRAPELAAVLDLESEPVTKLVEAFAYREMVLRSRINQAGRAVMLAKAAGGDLDQVAANLGVIRLEGESDAAFRRRAQLALEGYSSAGPRGAYIFHAVSADPRVRDVAVESPEPGEVKVTILSADGNGAPAQDLLDAVTATLNAETVRPLTDLVSVVAADITIYAVTAELTIAEGPDPQVVIQAALASLQAYGAERRSLGRGATRSGLFAALHVPGVDDVTLTAPAADVDVSKTESAVMGVATITVAGA